MTLKKRTHFESGWGRNYKYVEWEQVVAREETKFEMKNY